MREGEGEGRSAWTYEGARGAAVAARGREEGTSGPKGEREGAGRFGPDECFTTEKKKGAVTGEKGERGKNGPEVFDKPPLQYSVRKGREKEEGRSSPPLWKPW